MKYLNRQLRYTARRAVTGLGALMLLVPIAALPAGAQDAVPTISGPLSLYDAVRTALEHNPMAQAAGAQVSAAEARAGMAKAMTKPQLSVTGFAGKSSMGDAIQSPPGVMPSSITLFPDKSAVTGQAMLMYPISTGGRLSAAVKGAEALSAAVASDRASVERNITLETKLAYHRALLARDTVDVYVDLVKEAKERVRIAEASFREGRIARYDLLRNQAELADAEQQLVNAEREARVALIDLKAAMGVSQTSDITLSDELAYARIIQGLDELAARAVESRPELAAARARIRSAQSNVAAAKSAYKPQVYANVMGSVTGASGGSDSGYTAGITVGIPLADGGLRKSGVREAEAMLDAMKREEQQSLLAVQQDVHTAWAEVQAAERNVGLSQAAVEQAQEDYRVITLRYEAGRAINVEVLDALASLVRARNNRLMALYEHNVARDRLAKAIGEL